MAKNKDTKSLKIKRLNKTCYTVYVRTVKYGNAGEKKKEIIVFLKI